MVMSRLDEPNGLDVDPTCELVIREQAGPMDKLPDCATVWCLVDTGR